MAESPGFVGCRAEEAEGSHHGGCSSLPQNHGIAEVGRDFRRSSSPIPLLKQGPHTRSHRKASRPQMSP